MSFCTVKEVILCVRASERKFIAAIGNRATAIANEIQQTELKIVFKMSENAAPLLLLVSGYFLQLSISCHIFYSVKQFICCFCFGKKMRAVYNGFSLFGRSSSCFIWFMFLDFSHSPISDLIAFLRNPIGSCDAVDMAFPWLIFIISNKLKIDLSFLRLPKCKLASDSPYITHRCCESFLCSKITIFTHNFNCCNKSCQWIMFSSYSVVCASAACFDSMYRFRFFSSENIVSLIYWFGYGYKFITFILWVTWENLRWRYNGNDVLLVQKTVLSNNNKDFVIW